MIDLQQLGFTQEELQQRVVNQICEQLLNSTVSDEDGDDVYMKSRFHAEIQERIKKQVTQSIDAIAQRDILPNVAAYIEGLVLQQTNAWGEKTGSPITFIEYLTKRAEAYMQEQVDWDGKGKGEKDSYSWSGKQTRITYLVHNHLHHSIETAMKDAMKIATSEIAKGLHETVRLKLNEVAAGIKVNVQTK